MKLKSYKRRMGVKIVRLTIKSEGLASLHTNSPLGMCYQSLFKRWCHLHYWRNNSQNNSNVEILMQTFENFLLQNWGTEFLDIAHK